MSAFPSTRHSVLREVRSADPETKRRGFEALAAAYWKPVYKYLRFRGRTTAEDAEDLTQGFFARAFEKGFFDSYDPARGRFRTFLRVCLDGFVANDKAAARSQKRGGGAPVLSLDFSTAEGELLEHPPAEGTDPEEFFRREWVRGVFAEAVAGLRARAREEGKDMALRLFERYDLDGPDAAEKLTYGALAEEAGIPVTQVTNHLAWARREFRRAALLVLEAHCGSEEEYRAEARDLFGHDAPA
jgi:RNA polymerase sigma factor (sigma-70 family)